MFQNCQVFQLINSICLMDCCNSV